jgi:DNA modification methylase
MSITIKNKDGLKLLKKIEDNSVDLILTDPPYIISKDSGMDKLYKKIQENNGQNMKTEDDWNKYKKTLNKSKEEIEQRIWKRLE